MIKLPLPRLAAPLLAAALCLFALPATAAQPATAPATQAPPLTKAQQAQIEQIVRNYLLSHPEMVEEMQQALQAKRDKANFAKIIADPRHFSIGPANAKVHIVEFFDYRCGYCKAALDWMMDKIAKRKDVRFTFVEFPILTEQSILASQAAVASIKQGRYLPFHRALMSSKGALEQKEIDAIAKATGLDVVRLHRDMNDPAVIALLQSNHDIANGAQISGTPAFYINGKFVRGGYQADLLDRELRLASAAKAPAR